jgi:predicted DNA-binding protein
MLVLRLTKDLEARLAELARRRGRTMSDLVRDAIVRLIEDAEDLEAARKALRRTGTVKTLRRLRKENFP